MRVGLIGTGAIAHKHADSYKEIGYDLVAVANRDDEPGRAFAEKYGAKYETSNEALCARPDIDYVDICTFPDSRLDIVKLAVANGKHVLNQKPICLDLKQAREMVDITRHAKLKLGIISQHRFDDSTMFLKKAIGDGRMGKLLQVDAYVKWHRPQSYYDRPGKGTWEVEGGGALINQAIHQVDLLLHLAGPVKRLAANWQLAAAHEMESEDVINTLLQYDSGATGVLQAATAIVPGYPERIEIHGTKGSATITGDKLTVWDVEGDSGDDVPLQAEVDSGASDPMAIGLEPIKRQFRDFGEAIQQDRDPAITGEDGYRALAFVLAAYESARSNQFVELD